MTNMFVGAETMLTGTISGLLMRTSVKHERMLVAALLKGKLFFAMSLGGYGVDSAKKSAPLVPVHGGCTLLAGLSLSISCTARFRPGPSSSCCSCSCLLETWGAAYFCVVSSHVVCLWGVNEHIANKRLSFLPRPSPVPSLPAPPQKSPHRCSAHRLGNSRLGSPTDDRNAHFRAVGWRCESPRPPAAPGHVVANHGQCGEEVHVQPLQLLD